MLCEDINDAKIKFDLSKLIFKNINDLKVICGNGCTSIERDEIEKYWYQYFYKSLIKRYSEFVEFSVIKTNGKDPEILTNLYSNVDCRIQAHLGISYSKLMEETSPFINLYGISIPYNSSNGEIDDDSWKHINFSSCAIDANLDCSIVMQFAEGFRRYSLLHRLKIIKHINITEIIDNNILNNKYSIYFKNHLYDKRIVFWEIETLNKISENRRLGKPDLFGLKFSGSLKND